MIEPSRKVAEEMIRKEGGCLVKWTQSLEEPNSFNSIKIICHVCVHSLEEYDEIHDISWRVVSEDEIAPWLNSRARVADCDRLHSHRARREKQAKESENGQLWEEIDE